MGNIFGSPTPAPPPPPQPRFRATQTITAQTQYQTLNRLAGRHEPQTFYRAADQTDPPPVTRTGFRHNPPNTIIYRGDNVGFPLIDGHEPVPDARLAQQRFVPYREPPLVVPERPRRRENAPAPRNQARCPYLAGDECRLAGNCPYCPNAGVVAREPPLVPAPTPAAPVEEPPPRLCNYFVQGHCRRGAACKFSHDKNNAIVEDNINASNDPHTYQFGGAWAKFGNGATVSKVYFSTDFSAVRIRNLPISSTVKSVKALLADVGLRDPAVDIRVTPIASEGKSIVTIKAADPSFARNVCNRLGTYTTLPDIEAVVIPVQMGQSQNLHQIDCRKVHCSWLRPARSVQLKFTTKNAATRVRGAFNSGNYKVLGNKVSAGAVTGQDGPADRPEWTLTLHNLPDTIEENHIMQGIPQSDKPHRIEIKGSSYEADPELHSTIVQTLLLQYGQLERWEVSKSSQGKRINAYATFFEEAHARGAAFSLNNTPLSFSESTRLLVKVVTSTRFKVPVRIYHATEKQIKTQKAIWDRQFIRCFEYGPKGQYRNFRLEGENHPQVAKAKEAMEKIIGGDLIRVEGKDLDNANFKKGGDDFKSLRRIENSFKVVIIPDVRTSQFRVFGLEPNSEATLERIKAKIQECLSESHTIELTLDDFRWMQRGGYMLLQSRMGIGKVSLTITPRRKHISVKGSKADYNKAMSIMALRQSGSAAAISHSETACSSCWCEADDPIRMSCHHIYCSDCFIGMCVAEITGQKEFHISCIKSIGSGQDTCQKAFSLSELQEHLPSETFGDILEASFASYVGRHPAEFRYCPTPDCGQIYRVGPPDAASPNTFTCERCLTPTCTSCHSSHARKTCDQPNGKSRRPLQALDDRKKAELGIRDCPRCSLMLEKTGGCNHMTCRCGAHVCWVCLATFDIGSDCYDHMRKVHGGIGG